MKHIILFLFVLLALISCVKEEEDSPLLSAPVITLKEESPIYKTKIGREITIAPVYENTDSETTFNWTIDGKSICTASTLTFSADEAGRYFILISASPVNLSNPNVQYRRDNRKGDTYRCLST